MRERGLIRGHKRRKSLSDYRNKIELRGGEYIKRFSSSRSKNICSSLSFINFEAPGSPFYLVDYNDFLIIGKKCEM